MYGTHPLNAFHTDPLTPLYAQFTIHTLHAVKLGWRRIVEFDLHMYFLTIICG